MEKEIEEIDPCPLEDEECQKILDRRIAQEKKKKRRI